MIDLREERKRIGSEEAAENRRFKRRIDEVKKRILRYVT